MNIMSARKTHASFAGARSFSMVLLSLLLLAMAAFFFVSDAQAAPRKGYEAVQVTLPKQGFTMAPGSTQEVMIGLQNIGEKTWVNSGYAFVSVYTYDPKYRTSVFESSTWSDFTQAAKLSESSVAPGNTGHIYVTLTAPNTPGTYRETFNLAAEDVTWIPGGEFTLVINVAGEASTSVKQVAPVQELEEEIAQVESVEDGTASPDTDGLSAMILLRSAKELTAKAGAEISYKVGIKNTGSVTWGTREIRTGDIAIASADTEHSSWLSSTKLALNDTGSVKPGGLDFLEFKFVAPSTKGSHTVRYTMAVNDTVIPDFYIDIPVEVTSGAAAIINEPITVDESDVKATNTIDEPIVRIGLLTIDGETDWVTEISCNSTWRLEDQEGGLLGVMANGEMVRAFYKNQRYYYNRGKGIEQTHKYLRFVPDNDDAICTIENFDRRVSRNAAYADNQFRDTLELQYIPYKDEVWVINELPIEEYLYGLAETSNLSHHEFKKTLITIARTYATYHWERNTKHHGYFHMNAYADDQVYKGYEYEQRHFNIKVAADDTAGITVNYEGKTAITPYFSRSDGRTRDWSEVWGGYVPWVRGVPAPCDLKNGRTLWGHGVGLSASEALCMAREGEAWDDILKYFYTGVELNKRWQ